MRVFVSSTVFDLIDVRSEIAELLRSLGIAPVLSDDKLSDFAVKFDVNSIETCLINVESCDEVIVILDKRYGPSLASAGFADLSATHLEYRHAVKCKKPIHFYVRDRLEGDYATWSKNRGTADLNLSWVQQKDFRLFELLAEHRKLSNGQNTSNWITPFTSSIDLKASLRRHFEAAILPQTLLDAIHNNRFPLFAIEVKTESVTIDHCPSLTLKCKVTNIGGAPAFNFVAHWEHKRGEEMGHSIIAPGQSLTFSLIYGLDSKQMGTETHLHLEYESGIGVAVVDEFQVGGRVRPGPQPMIMGGGRLENRRFRRIVTPFLQVADV